MHLTPRINKLVGKAMHTYNMLDDGDSVLIAVSGGIDSLVVTWLLKHWRRKAPIDYQLFAIHLDMGFGTDEHRLVRRELERLEVPFLIEKTTFGKDALLAENGKSGCFHCAKKRRNRLFELAREKGMNKIVFGHHQEDIIETFFLNLMYGGNVSTMVPLQSLFNGNLTIIRPLAYLAKSQIIDLGNTLGITPVANPCPLAEESKRVSIRNLLNTLYEDDPRIKSNIFSGLSNIKTDYLLKPTTRG
ncbi:ATP-binding protein [Thermodesulfobacteriota bacterium]